MNYLPYSQHERMIVSLAHIRSHNESAYIYNIRQIIISYVLGPPVEVGVTMYVLSISSLSEVQMVKFVQFFV